MSTITTEEFSSSFPAGLAEPAVETGRGSKLRRNTATSGDFCLEEATLPTAEITRGETRTRAELITAPWTRSDGKVYTYTKFEPDHARRVFACFEQPDLKAPFTISVTAPADWAVISTSADPRAAAAAARAVPRWDFPPTPPLPTYLAHVTAGEYVSYAARTPRRAGR
jgi:aminopeptidase N